MQFYAEKYGATEASARAAEIITSLSKDTSGSHHVYPLDIRQFLPKGSKLKNTPHVYAMVAYTGVFVPYCR